MNKYRFVLTMKAPHQGPALKPSIGPEEIEFRSDPIQAEHATSPPIMSLLRTLDAAYVTGGPQPSYLERWDDNSGEWRDC